LTKKTTKKRDIKESALKEIPFEDAVKSLLQAPSSPKAKKGPPQKFKDKD
jgi:hypothetical protein